MDRFAANSLRILGIVVTVILVIGGCYLLLAIALVVVMRGGLTQSARILHPQAANAIFGALLATVALITAGIVTILKLVKGIVRGPGPSQFFATTPGPAATAAATLPGILSPLSASRYRSPVGRRTIDRLVLALAAQIAVNAITLFERAALPVVPQNWTLMLLPPFILFEAPSAILIYVLLKRPGRPAFAFLIAMLAIPILETLFNPVLLYSYRQIYMNHAMGFVWVVLSGLIYIVALVLAYLAIRQTGLQPTVLSVMLAAVATFFYFFLIREITPYLYSLWR